MSTRESVNLAFYGRPVTAADLILEEKLPLPVAASSLYTALDQLLTCVGAAKPPRSISSLTLLTFSFLSICETGRQQILYIGIGLVILIMITNGLVFKKLHCL